jgi:hypothetical protein
MECCDPNNFAIGATVKDKQDNNREAVVIRKHILGTKSNSLEVRDLITMREEFSWVKIIVADTKSATKC